MVLLYPHISPCCLLYTPDKPRMSPQVISYLIDLHELVRYWYHKHS